MSDGSVAIMDIASVALSQAGDQARRFALLRNAVVTLHSRRSLESQGQCTSAGKPLQVLRIAICCSMLR